MFLAGDEVEIHAAQPEVMSTTTEAQPSFEPTGTFYCPESHIIY